MGPQQQQPGLHLVHSQDDLEPETPFARCAATDFSSLHAPLQYHQPTLALKKKEATVLEPDWSCLNPHSHQEEPSHLYGRENELKELRRIFHQSLNSDNQSQSPSLVLISGHSGSGKSALASAALKSLAVKEHGGYYLVGKFDQLQAQHAHEPYAPFVATLSELVLVWESTRSANWRQEVGNRLLQALGNDHSAVLQALVPALSRILPPVRSDSATSWSLPASTTAMGREAQQDRLKAALCIFFKELCQSSPLVLCIDDCQWADAASLVLLDSVLQASISKLTVVAICRCEEVDVRHGFAALLRALEDSQQGGTPIQHIQVPSLSLEATNQLLSNVVKQPPETCLSWTERIHPKTQGNAFVLLQLLQALCQKQVLVPSDHQWVWNDQNWVQHFANMELDVVDLVSSRMQSLPLSCRKMLQTAAFLGADFRLDILQRVWEGQGEERSQLGHTLEEAIGQRLLIRKRPQKYSFSHDQIQLGAYALASTEQEQAELHLAIGRTLYQSFTSDSTKEGHKLLNDHIFLVVNQMIQGSGLITTETDKHGLAHLCLQAGKQSSCSSDFHAAIFYFETGIELVASRSGWRDEYLLCLDLYSSLAEATCSTGNFTRMDESIDAVLQHSRNTGDTVRAYTTRIYALSARLQPKEALALGKQVLAQLGVKLPTKPGIWYFIRDLIKVKGKLSKFNAKDSILSLPDIDPQNRNHIAAMTILSMMATCTYAADENELYPAICFMMIKITLKHGLSAMSSHGFCLLAVVLSAMDNYTEAYQYSQLALKIIDRYPRAKAEWFPRVAATVNGLVAGWTQPLALTYAPLLEAHAVGRDSGDIEFCILAGHWHSLNSYVSGRPLRAIEKSHAAFYNQMVEYKHETWLAMADVMLQALRHLIGDGIKNPRVLHFNTSTDARKSASYEAEVQCATTLQMVLSFHYDDIFQALDCSKKLMGVERAMKPSMFLWIYYLYDGMVALKAARAVRGGKRRTHLAKGRSMAKKLEGLAKTCPENFQHAACLLKAEVADLQGKLGQAEEFYSKAISCAKQEGFLHVHAIACEYYGMAYHRRGEKSLGDDLLKQAVTVYHEWGADAIASYKEIEFNLN